MAASAAIFFDGGASIQNRTAARDADPIRRRSARSLTPSPLQTTGHAYCHPVVTSFDVPSKTTNWRRS
jgi:hypothetical protein